MQKGRASHTAEQNALFRALEANLPEHRRVCNDPLARYFLTWPFRLVARIGVVPAVCDLLAWYIDYRWPGVRTSVTARTRLIDEAITVSLNEPIEQFVILGAGLDSRAYRLPRLQGVRVFEVDHPDTQAHKRAALARAPVGKLDHVRFVTIDFIAEDLASVMANAGYRDSARTFILWEGVTNYLTEAAVDTTMRWCARALPGSLLLFTYVHRDILTRPDTFVGTKNLFAALERSGERFTFGIDPSDLPAFLAERGMSLINDTGASEYRARYYGDAARKMRGHEFYRVALARIS